MFLEAADAPEPVVDPWIALAARATVTERMRLGPMVTPLPRRRPWKLAREAASLDQLSEDPKEAMRAFAEKRPAVFTGR